MAARSSIARWERRGPAAFSAEPAEISDLRSTASGLDSWHDGRDSGTSGLPARARAASPQPATLSLPRAPARRPVADPLRPSPRRAPQRSCRPASTATASRAPALPAPSRRPPLPSRLTAPSSPPASPRCPLRREDARLTCAKSRTGSVEGIELRVELIQSSPPRVSTWVACESSLQPASTQRAAMPGWSIGCKGAARSRCRRGGLTAARLCRVANRALSRAGRTPAPRYEGPDWARGRWFRRGGLDGRPPPSSSMARRCRMRETPPLRRRDGSVQSS